MRQIGKSGVNLINKEFWSDKKVLVTGHSGFKGSWLSLWLQQLNAKVAGISLDPPSSPYLFDISNIDTGMKSYKADIRDLEKIQKIFTEFEPEIIFHLAAQSIVLKSYKDPIDTLNTNIIGTANLFECTKRIRTPKVFVNITSDKCYENTINNNTHFESDPMGGDDIYSCSKGCSELITNAYHKSFFQNSSCQIASTRAGNVLGGGDWADYRLVPDIFRSLKDNQKLKIRNPDSVRPWQHVLDPLAGYLILAEKLYVTKEEFCEGWNFGPDEEGTISVIDLITKLQDISGINLHIEIESAQKEHESHILRLNNSKSKDRLNWKPKLNIDQTLKFLWEWQNAYENKKNMNDFSKYQIEMYCSLL